VRRRRWRGGEEEEEEEVAEEGGRRKAKWKNREMRLQLNSREQHHSVLGSD
jgi:hypothetical protein